jgi:hypothetical protein
MKQGNRMSQRSKQEYFQGMCACYRQATSAGKEHLLDELCQIRPRHIDRRL